MKWPLIVLGLTGSIGMGKSTAAEMFRRLGVPVHDADATVRALQRPGGRADKALRTAFPKAYEKSGRLDRNVMASLVFGDAEKLRQLEAILHPLVWDEERTFLRRACLLRHRLAVLDIPLLFETGGDRRCDKVVVVSAPDFVQRQRVMKRPDMTPQKLADILRRQMKDGDKRRRADFIVEMGIGKAFSRRAILSIVKQTQRLSPKVRRSGLYQR